MKEPRRHPALVSLGTVLDRYTGQRGYQLFGNSQGDLDQSLVDRYADFVISDPALGKLLDLDAAVVKEGKREWEDEADWVLYLTFFDVDGVHDAYAQHDVPLEDDVLDQNAARRVIEIIDDEISRLVLEKAAKLSDLSVEIDQDDRQ